MPTNDEIPPLAPDAAALLRRARESATPSPQTAQRVWERTSDAIGAAGAGAAAAAAGTSGASSLAWLTSPVRLAVLASFAAGVITGSTAVSVVRNDAELVRMPVPVKVQVPVPRPVVTERVVVVPSPTAAETRSLVQLSESTLVLKAQQAVERGDWEYAAMTLDAATVRFPRADFREERDYLSARVLVGMGDPSAATAVDAFRRTYPRSGFTERLEAALRASEAP